MATPTYEAIATITLSSTASSVEFSSIPQDYRDLVLAVDGTTTGSFTTIILYFNSDAGSNYSRIYMEGNGSADVSNSTTNSGLYAGLIDSVQTNSIMQIMDYSATDKHTTVLARGNTAQTRVRALAGRWANTAAITNIEVKPETNSFDTGTTLALYGIAS